MRSGGRWPAVAVSLTGAYAAVGHDAFVTLVDLGTLAIFGRMATQ
jgi:hypothetical protein